MKYSKNNLNSRRSVPKSKRDLVHPSNGRNVKTILTILTMFTFVAVSFAQQGSKLAMFSKNIQMWNPAVAGANETTSLVASFRTQWAGLEGAPRLQTVGFGTPIGKSMGIGLNIVNDKVFVERQTYVSADFSYGLTLGESTNLYLGLRGGGVFNNIDTSRLTGGDTSMLLTQNEFNPNVGIGAYLYHENYFVSLSVPKLLKNERIVEEATGTVVAEDNMNFSFMGGYNWNMSDMFALKPAVMVNQLKGAPLSSDFLLAVAYNKVVELGGYYSTDDLLGGYVSATINWLQFGYSYSTSSNSELSKGLGGIHEFFVKFSFERNKEEVSEE